MRKIAKVGIAVAAVIVALAFVVSTASAGRTCDYHQWPPGKKCKKPAKIVLEGVYFDTGSARIRPESYDVLNDNAKKLKHRKDLRIIVIGYTDNRGSYKMNQRLSAARAKSVRNYFVTKGIDHYRISAEGRGPADPIATNSTEEGRAKNRRIELHTAPLGD